MLVEQKAAAEKDAARLKAARERLFSLYASGNNGTRAAEYVKLLLSAATTETEKQALTAGLACACLTPPSLNMDMAVSLIEKYLDDRDLDAESPLAKSIKAYMNEPPAGADPNALFDRLRQIKVKDSTARGSWQQQLGQWAVLRRRRSAGSSEGRNMI